MIWCTLHLRGHDGGPFGSSSWEKKLFVINELDDDLRCTLSMEEGSELEDSEVHHEAGLMDLVAVSLDQFSLWLSSWCSSPDAEDSELHEESEGANRWNQQLKPSPLLEF